MGQCAPPNTGVARTCRVRCCRPAPQVLLQPDQAVNADTTQSWGHGIRQACSAHGLPEKNSQIRVATAVRLAVRTQRTERRWTPCCAVTHSEGRGLSSLARKGTRKQSPQGDTSHSKRSWCHSHTLKQGRRLAGLSACGQWEWWVVQPSVWTHHSVRVWSPPEPHSSPVQ